MSDHEVNQRRSLVEARSPSNNLTFSIPVNKASLIEFWKVIMNQVNGVHIQCLIRLCEFFWIKLCFIAGVAHV